MTPERRQAILTAPIGAWYVAPDPEERARIQLQAAKLDRRDLNVMTPSLLDGNFLAKHWADVVVDPDAVLTEDQAANLANFAA